MLGKLYFCFNSRQNPLTHSHSRTHSLAYFVYTTESCHTIRAVCASVGMCNAYIIFYMPIMHAEHRRRRRRHTFASVTHRMCEKSHCNFINSLRYLNICRSGVRVLVHCWFRSFVRVCNASSSATFVNYANLCAVRSSVSRSLIEQPRNDAARSSAGNH